MLFTGIMLTASGPKVLEYNVRFGDPETQSLIPLLTRDTDLAEVMLACVEGRLEQVKVESLPGFACNVVIAAGGYPSSFNRGDTIELGPISDGTFFLNFCSLEHNARYFGIDTCRCSYLSLWDKHCW